MSLPTLDQVLTRQTLPPICLYNYYIVLRDRLEMETLLDFWLDVQQAEVLYRRFLKYRNKQATDLSAQQERHDHERPARWQTRNPSLVTTSSVSTTTTTTTTQSSKKNVPTTQDVLEAVERIYLRYIVPHAEKELFLLPPSLRTTITRAFQSDQPSDPAVFAKAKHHVYHILLQSTFQPFLYYKAYRNLTLHQQIGRVACGLLALLVGFSLEFTLIFLDIRPWHKRLWGCLPIGAGVFCLVTALTGLDPIWVLIFRVSETTTFHFNTIKQPEIKSILRKRALLILLLILLILAILLVFFCALPGKRL